MDCPLLIFSHSDHFQLSRTITAGHLNNSIFVVVDLCFFASLEMEQIGDFFTTLKNRGRLRPRFCVKYEKVYKNVGENRSAIVKYSGFMFTELSPQ